MGKSGTTRAGYEGSYDTYVLKGGTYGDATLTGWTEALAQKQGFGVFAYYTKNDTYGSYHKGTYASEADRTVSGTDRNANFMFNQLVWWKNDQTNDYVTKWTYTPIKYWPNEVVSASNANEVDDQNNNTSNDPATTDQENGGKVSFFAYAPYVDFGSTTPTGLTATNADKNGIIAINGATALATSNAYDGDPYLTYQLPRSGSSGKAVDLLWGTAGINGTGVTGATNLGVQGNDNSSDDRTLSSGTPPSETYTYSTYKASILGQYRTNVDLTKQTTGGTINFAFKHALAKIGGSYTGSGVGDDEDGSTATNGLMVILDLDDLKGAESGGSLEAYKETPSTKPEWNKYNTKVTINSIDITSSKQLTDPKGVNAVANNLAFEFGSDYIENLISKGDFNLATGQWLHLDNSNEITYSQSIVPSSSADYSGYPTADDKTKDGILSEELAEHVTGTPTANTKGYYEALPIGVTTVAKNVYEGEANPLVFIPGSRPIIEFTIVYTVRTYDSNLKNVYTEVKQKIKKRLYITDPVELNKQYNILMHLGLTGVKFTATVSDWETIDATGTTTDPGDGKSPVTVYEDEVEHVYLPINVGQPLSVAPKTLSPVSGNSQVNGSDTKKYEVGSNIAGNVLTFDGMQADFGEESKDVEMSHVNVVAVDKKTGEPVDWITYTLDSETGKISTTANTSTDEREAIVRIIYDNVADEYTVMQYGRKVKEFTLSVYDAPAMTTPLDAAALAALESGNNKYYTKITGYKYYDVKADGTDGDEQTAAGTTIPVLTGYKLKPGDITTVSGTTFSTKQYTASVYNPTLRDESTTKTSVEFDGVSQDLTLKQKAPDVKSITLTVNGSETEQVVNASVTKSGTVSAIVYFKDNNGQSAGSATIPNTAYTTEAAGVYSISFTAAATNGIGSPSTTDIGTNNYVTFTTNTGTNDLTGTVQVKYGTGGTAIPSNAVTIKQTKP